MPPENIWYIYLFSIFICYFVIDSRPGIPPELSVPVSPLGLKVLGGGVVTDASQDPGDWLIGGGYWRLPPVTVLASYCLCPRFVLAVVSLSGTTPI